MCGNIRARHIVGHAPYALTYDSSLLLRKCNPVLPPRVSQVMRLSNKGRAGERSARERSTINHPCVFIRAMRKDRLAFPKLVHMGHALHDGDNRLWRHNP